MESITYETPQVTTTLHKHRDLIELCKKGNRPAQFKLYELYVDAMYNTSLRMVKHPDDAEDITQEAFVKAFTNLNSFKYRSTFGSWLKRIVINQSVNFLNKKRMPICDFRDSTTESPMDLPTKPDLSIELVKKGIELLSDGYRQILSLYLFEGYDHQEISAIAGISVSTSKSQYHRAKKKLLEIIKEESWMN